MAVTSFIPELWAAQILQALEKAHVALAFVNRDYEGEIKKMGDTVHVNSIGDLTIRDYTPGVDIEDPETLSTEDQELKIDQAKYFNFQVDDVNAVQAAGNLLSPAMQRAGYQLADGVDAKIFATMSAACTVADGNRLASKTITTPAEAYELLVDLRTKLSENSAPKIGRKVAVTPAFYGLLLKDARFVSAGTEKTDERLENGYVGRAAGFEVYETNNLPKVGDNEQIIAGVPMATSFAEQLVETEAYRPEKAFSDAVKGLDVYGVKVFRKKCLVACDFEVEGD